MNATAILHGRLLEGAGLPATCDFPLRIPRSWRTAKTTITIPLGACDVAPGERGWLFALWDSQGGGRAPIIRLEAGPDRYLTASATERWLPECYGPAYATERVRRERSGDRREVHVLYPDEHIFPEPAELIPVFVRLLWDAIFGGAS